MQVTLARLPAKFCTCFRNTHLQPKQKQMKYYQNHEMSGTTHSHRIRFGRKVFCDKLARRDRRDRHRSLNNRSNDFLNFMRVETTTFALNNLSNSKKPEWHDRWRVERRDATRAAVRAMLHSQSPIDLKKVNKQEFSNTKVKKYQS